MSVDTIRRIIDRLNVNKKALDELNDKYIKAYRPQGYKESTSYQDYDMIRGSRKDLRIEDYEMEKYKLITQIELDEEMLLNARREVEINEYLPLLKDNKNKVKFLRIVKGLTQEKTGELIGLSTRRVQQIEKSLKN